MLRFSEALGIRDPLTHPHPHPHPPIRTHTHERETPSPLFTDSMLVHMPTHVKLCPSRALNSVHAGAETEAGHDQGVVRGRHRGDVAFLRVAWHRDPHQAAQELLQERKHQEGLCVCVCVCVWAYAGARARVIACLLLCHSIARAPAHSSPETQSPFLADAALNSPARTRGLHVDAAQAVTYSALLSTPHQDSNRARCTFARSYRPPLARTCTKLSRPHSSIHTHAFH